MSFLKELKTAGSLITTDLKIFRGLMLGKYIDISIWMICVLFVNAYLFPQFGMSQFFGILSFAGMLAAVGMFEVFGSVVSTVVDFEYGFTTNYRAILPIPVWMMLVAKIVSNSVTYMFFTLAILPIGKVMLFNDFLLSKVNWPLFILLMVVGCIFYGAFALFAASVTKKQDRIGRVWTRFIFPMWFMGGFAFSWAVFKTISRTFAYIDLINPMIYMTEAYRAVIMGQEGFINFWYCIGALIFFTGLFGYFGIVRLKKYLDFV